MRRSRDRQQERRYAGHSNTRHSVAVEAARLLYTRELKEYFQAKREAARRLSTTVLPTNSEIHQQLLLLADKLEGEGREQRLAGMRRVALEMMELLQDFEPRLIGSTWTGHIRHGSDIDLNLYGDSLEAVMSRLETALIPFELERVHSRKQGHEREFLHLHVAHPSGMLVEVTLYPREDLKIHPTCSITGGPMARGTLAQLRQILREPSPALAGTATPVDVRAELLLPLQLDRLLPDLPELRDCLDVRQNHYHHLDVFDHSVAVAQEVQRFLESGFAELSPWDQELRRHFASPGPMGWSRGQILMLAALCHDIGKPATWNLHRSGRIQFHGHEKVGETMARRLAERWNLPTAVGERLARLVALHMIPVLYVSHPEPPSQLYEMFSLAGDLAPELLLLSLADVTNARGPAQPEHRLAEQKSFVLEMLEEFFERGFLRFPNPPVSAVDLDQELGIGEGRLRERLLHRLTRAYVDEEYQGREDGLIYAAELLELSFEEL